MVFFKVLLRGKPRPSHTTLKMKIQMQEQIKALFRPIQSISLVTCLTLSVGLTGCGNGNTNDSEIASIPKDTIIDGSGLSPVVATIDGFGSIIADGQRYTTDNAEIFIQGESSTTEQLAIGDFVTLLQAAEDNEIAPAAKTVYYEAPVIGAVSRVETTSETTRLLHINGQRVQIDLDTIIDDELPLMRGQELDRIEVSGPATGNGLILATRIYAAPNSSDLLSGEVNDHDSSVQQFTINGVNVNYQTAATTPTINNGDLVSASGTYAERTNTLQATSIRVRNDNLSTIDLDTNAPVSLLGIVADTIGSTFILSSTSVLITPDTVLSEGINREVTDGDVVIVTGKKVEGDILIADSIVFEASATESIVGEIDSIRITGADPNTLQEVGEITIFDQQLIIDSNTRLIGMGENIQSERIKLGDIRAGDTATAAIYSSGEQLIIKTLIVIII